MTTAAALNRPSAVPAATADHDHDAMAETIKAAWEAGDRPDAAAALAVHPELAANRAVAIDLAYTEYCLRLERGEALDPDAFCARFPYRDKLAEVLSLHTLFQDNPGILERVTRVWPEPGDRLGDFEIIGELGRGASARVYLSREVTAGGRPVALKVSDDVACDADLLGPLSHPHLIPVLSSRRVTPWTVLVMPFLGAATLRTVLAAWQEDGQSPQSGKRILEAAAAALPAGVHPAASPGCPIRPEMSYKEAIRTIAGGVFSALDYLHSREIAHRDIKPSNVLLAPTGHPYLLDLNLAVGGQAAAETAGTPAYMSPEQLRLMADPAGPRPADWRPSDVFAAGVMMYELLTGRHPYAPDYAGSARRDLPELATDLLARQAAGPVSLLSEVNSRLGSRLVAALERCLDPDPARRPTAAELAAVFAPEPPRRGPRRLVAALAALAVVCGMTPAALVLRATADSHQQVSVPADSMERGRLLFREGENGYQFAALEFMKSGAEHQDGRAYAIAAYCFALAKNHPNALLAGTKAERMGVTSAAVYANRAHSRNKLCEYAEAKGDCDKALAQQPELRSVRYLRAYVSLQLMLQQPQSRGSQLLAEAIDDIRKVTSGSPNSADMWLAAALLCSLASDQQTSLKDEAIASVREAILQGKSPSVLKKNRILSTALGKLPAFQQALQLAPGPTGNNEFLPLVNPEPGLLVTGDRP